MKSLSLSSLLAVLTAWLALATFVFPAARATAAAPACAPSDLACVITFSNLEGDGMSADGPKLWTSFTLDMNIRVPVGVRAGDQIALIPSEPFYFSSFEDKEIRSADGRAVFATISAPAPRRLVLTFLQDSVDHGNVTARVKLTASADPTVDTARTATFSFTAGTPGTDPSTWANVGPGQLFYLPAARVVESSIGGTHVFLGTDPAVLTSAIFGFDPDSFDPTALEVVFTARPVDGFPKPAFGPQNQPLRVFTDQYFQGTNRTVGYREDAAVAASGNSIKLTLPADWEAKDTTDSDGGLARVDRVRLAFAWHADLPLHDYHFDATIYYQGRPVLERMNYAVKSGQLDGLGDGNLLSARINTEKAIVGSDKTHIFPEETLTYEISTTSLETLRNAYQVITTDTLPEGVSFISASDGGTLAGNTVTWPARTYQAGQTRTYRVTVQVDPGASGEVLNTATNRGLNACNGTDIDSVCSATAAFTVAKPDFRFTKSAQVLDSSGDEVLANPGDTIVYSFVVKNVGNVPLPRVLLTDEKLGVENQPCWDADVALQPGESVTCSGDFNYVITEDDAQAGEVINTATAITEGVPPREASVTTATRPSPAAPTGQSLDPQSAAVAPPEELAKTGVPAGWAASLAAILVGVGLAAVATQRGSRLRTHR